LLAESVEDRRRRARAYRNLISSGAMQHAVEDFARGRWAPSPPVRHHLNKPDGRQKVVFTFDAADELMFKALNRVLQPAVEPALSPLCHSFRPGRGPRSAYAQVFGLPALDRLASLHVDVRDYFNSIPIEQLLESLPAPVSTDRALMRALSVTLRDRLVLADGRIVEDGHKGVMAGTPLAPLLSNLYLRPVDDAFQKAGGAYVRYADDILVLGDSTRLEEARGLIERRLGDLGLALNERKTRYTAPGQPWEFLGFRFERGSLDVAPNTAAKLRRRARRLARRAADRDLPVVYAVRRLNRRLYGVGGRRQDFSWASWFFPLLSSTSTLAWLDAVIQEQLRFAATGRHERRNLRLVPYSDLVRAGYVPLVSAYHAFRTSWRAYRSLLDRRASG
jgi:RNA-directed DNA polymerase